MNAEPRKSSLYRGGACSVRYHSKPVPYPSSMPHSPRTRGIFNVALLLTLSIGAVVSQSSATSSASPTQTPSVTPSLSDAPYPILSKRGLAESTAWSTFLCADLAAAQLAWHYAWNEAPGNATCGTLFDGTSAFVAMAWGKNSVPVSGLFSRTVALLGFNEPNMPSQSNMTPAAAAALWPRLQSTAQQNGFLLGSPAIVPCSSGCAYVRYTSYRAAAVAPPPPSFSASCVLRIPSPVAGRHSVAR
jgi:hypothetical protein